MQMHSDELHKGRFLYIILLCKRSLLSLAIAEVTEKCFDRIENITHALKKLWARQTLRSYLHVLFILHLCYALCYTLLKGAMAVPRLGSEPNTVGLQ